MIFDCLVEFFEKFQTFLLGLLGFAGVIYTIIMNARLARQQHERELSHERTALRTALRGYYEDRSQTLRKNNCGNFVLIPEYVPNQVYRQLLDCKNKPQ